jgi:hypothetical protein
MFEERYTNALSLHRSQKMSLKTIFMQTHALNLAVKWTRMCPFNSILTRPAAAHERQHKDFSDEVAIQLSLVAKP